MLLKFETNISIAGTIEAEVIVSMDESRGCLGFSTSQRPFCGLFGDIFTLNSDYIAWELLKMALEVEYMIEYQHPVFLPWLFIPI